MTPARGDAAVVELKLHGRHHTENPRLTCRPIAAGEGVLLGEARGVREVAAEEIDAEVRGFIAEAQVHLAVGGLLEGVEIAPRVFGVTDRLEFSVRAHVRAGP